MENDVTDAAFWDDRYRSVETGWSGEPNAQVVSEVAGMAPGRALDAACGEGMDAIWLAARGWRVTATDISAVALERNSTIDIPADVMGRIDWFQADLITWTPPVASFDLVTAQFLHMPPPIRDAVFRKLAAAVKPAGTLLIVGHHPSDLQTTIPRPPLPELFYTAEDVAALLESSAWDIVISTARKREAIDPHGETVTIHDTVLRARRR
jgi:SAM-dependent methyltransferase